MINQHITQQDSKAESETGLDPFSVEIGKRLAEARTGLGLSQQAVHTRSKLHDSDGMGVSRAVLSLYERGVNKPGARELRILCEVLKITPNWLIFGAENPSKALRASSDFLLANEITLSVRLAYAMLALEPADRESIANLVFSLINKKLSDVQLSSLMMMANFLAKHLNQEIIDVVGDDAKDLPIIEIIDKFVAHMGNEFDTNWGNTRPAVSDDELGSFDPDHPLPPRKL